MNSNKEKPEIILGLIGAVGTDFNKFIREFNKHIAKTDYNTHEIKISKYLDVIDNQNDVRCQL